MNLGNDPAITGSHAGEDEWILAQFPEGYLGFAVEIGAHDGHYLSNTLLLERNGWTVLCIEPNPIHHAKLRERRKLTMDCACGSEPRSAMLYFSAQSHMHTHAGLSPTLGRCQPPPDVYPAGRVRVLALNECLERAEFPRLDALSLDVDGEEFEILCGLDLGRWTPRVVVIEDRSEVPAINTHLVNNGYELAAKMGYNNLWRRT